VLVASKGIEPLLADLQSEYLPVSDEDAKSVVSESNRHLYSFADCNRFQYWLTTL
jgi:hypothetical protein